MATSLEHLGAALADKGVRALVLRGQGGPGHAFVPSEHPEHSVELLVRRSEVRATRQALDRCKWRFRFGDRGLWRPTRSLGYVMDQGPLVYLYWGVPMGPLPAHTMHTLERVLWARSRDLAEGLVEPAAETLVVYLAIQSVRPTYRRETHAAHFADCARLVRDWDEAFAIACRCRCAGALRAVREDADAAEDGRPTVRDVPPLDDRVGQDAWRLLRAAQRRVRPWRVRSVMSGVPNTAGALVRCRFPGMGLDVGPGVFIPRPESELLVSRALRRIDGIANPVVVEVGTGCGAVAFAIARARPDAEIHASDLLRPAIRWARRNRRRLRITSVDLHRGSMLEPFPASLRGRVDAVVANLPYVPPSEFRNPGSLVRNAIRGRDDDGLGLYRQLIRSAPSLLRPGGALVFQCALYQWDGFCAELTSLGYRPDPQPYQQDFALVATAEL